MRARASTASSQAPEEKKKTKKEYGMLCLASCNGNRTSAGDLQSRSCYTRRVPAVPACYNISDPPSFPAPSVGTSVVAAASSSSPTSRMQCRSIRRDFQMVAPIAETDEAELLEHSRTVSVSTPCPLRGLGRPAASSPCLLSATSSQKRASSSEVFLSGTETSPATGSRQNCRPWRHEGGLFLPDVDGAVAANRAVVIDGLDVCLNHGRKGRLSLKGLESAVVWFVERAHPLKVVVPFWLLNYPLALSSGIESYEGNFHERHEVLMDMFLDGLVHALPDRGLPKDTSVPIDDVHEVVRLCQRYDAVLCSNNSEMFRSFSRIHPGEYFFIQRRQLLYSFDIDSFSPCYDQGRNGPLARELLSTTGYDMSSHTFGSFGQ